MAKGKHRRTNNPLPMLPGDVVYDLTPVDTTYTVVMSNGSGQTTLTLDGTKEDCWKWAETAGINGGLGPGIWQPVSIYPANDVWVKNDGSFTIIG